MLRKILSLCALILTFWPYIVFGWAMSWNPNSEADLAGYHVYISTTYQKAFSKNGDIASFSTGVSSQPSVCYDFNDSAYKVIYIGLTAYDLTGNESEATVGYFLKGNIVGDFFDGTPYTAARVDGQDLITFGLYFADYTTHQQINCSQSFIIQIPNQKQKADLDGSGRIDGRDLGELGLRYGNYANQ